MLTSPLRVAVLCSHRAPGLTHLLTCAARSQRWEIVCCLTSEDELAEREALDRHRIPRLRHPVRRFCDSRVPPVRLGDARAREDYDRQTARLLREYAPDVVLLAGYLLLLTGPMLEAFGNRIVNVHHSDLLLRDAAGRPRYPGLRAVRDAILAGERETRSTAHLVNEGLDEGPPLLRSWPFPVPEVAAWARATGEHDVLRRAIWAHQEWMLRCAFGPLMEHALELATGHERVPGCQDLGADVVRSPFLRRRTARAAGAALGFPPADAEHCLPLPRTALGLGAQP